jgi:hypothetical protein
MNFQQNVSQWYQSMILMMMALCLEVLLHFQDFVQNLIYFI